MGYLHQRQEVGSLCVWRLVEVDWRGACFKMSLLVECQNEKRKIGMECIKRLLSGLLSRLLRLYFDVEPRTGSLHCMFQGFFELEVKMSTSWTGANYKMRLNSR
jgi:hypothetical protein